MQYAGFFPYYKRPRKFLKENICFINGNCISVNSNKTKIKSLGKKTIFFKTKASILRSQWLEVTN